ncbi:MAG: hypothetical protein HYU44_07450 [Betaproteobacteria bacterium]|nr:hypothetical protein [Betaproteobacteria bacterium]MBI2292385.1 hypothetical protein [Betaproteobacteria bacterium]
MERTILANPALKAGRFRFEFGGVALQFGDISSELGRCFPQSLRLTPDFPAGKPCDLLSKRDRYIRHLYFPFCWYSGNTTSTSIVATTHDYVCSDQPPVYLQNDCAAGLKGSDSRNLLNGKL